jgi:proline racemase
MSLMCSRMVRTLDSHREGAPGRAIAGGSYLTGLHDFVLDPKDRLAGGFRIGPAPKDFGS